MRRIMYIVLAVMLLMLSGCSFIGSSDINGSEQIIPTEAQSDGSGGEDINANAVVDSESLPSSPSASNITNSAIDATTTSGTAISSNLTSNEQSTEASNEVTDKVVTNGAGKGMTVISGQSSILMTLFYQNKDGLLIPVSRDVIKQEGIAKAALCGLVDDPVIREQLDYYGFYPVLPRGTKIKGMTIKSGEAVVDFSKELLGYSSKIDEQKIISSIVYTLTGFQNISNVTLLVDGKHISKLTYGTDLSKSLNRNNTFINTEIVEPKENHVKCDLYFVANESKDINVMVPVSVQIEEKGTNTLPVNIFNELIKKSTDSKYFSAFPDGTKLLSCSVDGQMLTLDFSQEISNFGGSAKEDSLLNQIYYTVNQIEGIIKAKILINGKETSFPEGTEVFKVKYLPNTFNKIMDK